LGEQGSLSRSRGIPKQVARQYGDATRVLRLKQAEWNVFTHHRLLDEQLAPILPGVKLEEAIIKTKLLFG
jgi:hypothetical protein